MVRKGKNMENFKKSQKEELLKRINNMKPFIVKKSKSKIFRTGDLIKIGFIDINQEMTKDCIFITEVAAHQFFEDCKLVNGINSKEYFIRKGTPKYDFWNRFLYYRWMEFNYNKYLVESVLEFNRSTKEYKEKTLISSVSI